MHYIEQIAKTITVEMVALLFLLFVFGLGWIFGFLSGCKKGLKRGLDESFSKEAGIKLP